MPPADAERDSSGTDAGPEEDEVVVEVIDVRTVPAPTRPTAEPERAGEVLEEAIADLVTIGVKTSVGLLRATFRAGARTTGAVISFAADTPPGRIAKRSAVDLAATVAHEVGPALVEAAETAEQQLSRLLHMMVPAVIESIDINDLLSRVDVDALIDQVDVDALIDQVDLEALVEQVDLVALVERSEIGQIVAESTSQVAGSALDLARRQVVGLDVVLMRAVDRMLRRDPDAVPLGPASLLMTDSP